jgi:hypothetical protein
MHVSWLLLLGRNDVTPESEWVCHCIFRERLTQPRLFPRACAKVQCSFFRQGCNHITFSNLSCKKLARHAPPRGGGAAASRARSGAAGPAPRARRSNLCAPASLFRAAVSRLRRISGAWGHAGPGVRAGRCAAPVEVELCRHRPAAPPWRLRKVCLCGQVYRMKIQPNLDISWPHTVLSRRVPACAPTTPRRPPAPCSCLRIWCAARATCAGSGVQNITAAVVDDCPGCGDGVKTSSFILRCAPFFFCCRTT